MVGLAYREPPATAARPSPVASQPLRAASGRRRVVIVQRLVPHYRVALFERLAERLAGDGIELRVVAGQPRDGEAFEDCRDRLACVVPIENRYLRGGFYLQPVLDLCREADLVIIEHAVAPLANHLLLWRRALGRQRPKLAFWGHGDDLQRNGWAATLRRPLKRLYARLPDHWFAYTELSRSLLHDAGVPDERITVVNNSIDLSGAVARQDLSPDERMAIRRSVGLGPGPCAVFCSRLRPGKGLEFLIEACRQARRAVPDLQLLVIGDGPLESWLCDEAKRDPSLVLAGARYGVAKARLLASADFMAMPQELGLSILDAFAAGLPVLTVRNNQHGPEVVYLEHHVNALLTERTTKAFAEGMMRLALSSDQIDCMSQAAVRSSCHYSLDKMVLVFSSGILMALSSKDLLPRSIINSLAN